MENIFHANGNQKTAGVGILLSDKTIVNIYAFNIGTPQYVRQTLTDKKAETEINPIIEGNFNTPHTPMD